MQVTGFLKKNLNPGPGSYQLSSQRSTIYFSFKGKGKNDDRERTYQPGPGTCTYLSI